MNRAVVALLVVITSACSRDKLEAPFLVRTFELARAGDFATFDRELRLPQTIYDAKNKGSDTHAVLGGEMRRDFAAVQSNASTPLTSFDAVKAKQADGFDFVTHTGGFSTRDGRHGMFGVRLTKIDGKTWVVDTSVSTN